MNAYQPHTKIRAVDLRRVDCHPDFWYPIAWSEEVKPGKMIARAYAGEPVAVIRGANGDLFALEDRCAPRQVPLTHGVVAGCTVKWINYFGYMTIPTLAFTAFALLTIFLGLAAVSGDDDAATLPADA